AAFDLTLSLAEREDGIAGELVYDADLYAPATAARLMASFTRVLTALAADAGAPLWRLALLAPDERRQVLTAWNATARALPATSVVGLFEAQAAARPEGIAVSFGEEALSYGDLHQRVEALARLLRARGIGPECVVGVLLERSVELVAGVLSVLKAGGAFLPLDPGHPAARLAQVLGDAGAALVLTTRALAPRLPAATPVLLVDADDDEASDDAPFPAPLADQLAYVIYTSGSTGAPKGAMLAHRGLANLALAHIRDCDLVPGDRLLQLAQPGFDVAVAELAMTLSAGATLVLASADDLLPGAPLARLLVGEKISHVMMVPSVLASLPPEALAPCRVLVVGGEPCAPELVARHAPGQRMLNAYGPTEATVCAAMSKPLAVSEAPPPLGSPIANLRAYVLDDHLSPVGVGCVGELYLGGVGVARGYVGRGDWTAERFIADPFGEAGGRLYRTGDLGRWRGDGVLEFLGRRDGQVKLRGVRIELGEVEAALLSHAGVSGAAADVRADRLVGYVVGAGVSAASLGAHL